MYDPELYELLHRGQGADASYYAEACREGDAVLELGCGYGRLLQVLVPRVRSYCGLDRDTGLLRLAGERRAALPAEHARRVALLRGDMRSFQLQRRFDRILIPHSGLFCLGSDADVLACLRCVRSHLTADGELMLDTYAADGFHRDCGPEDVAEDSWEWVTRVALADIEYEVFERSCWRRDAQQMTVTYRYVPRDGGPEREGVIEHRYLLSRQLRTLLERAGFRLVHQGGDFERGRFTLHSEMLVIRARIGHHAARRGQ